MYLGKVVGTVVSTSKNEKLVGTKLLIVERLDERLQSMKTTQVTVDTVGAGNGETVIVATGGAARKVADIEDAPVDAAIVGIVDTVEVE